MASAPYVITDRKPANSQADVKLARQIDQLWRISSLERDKQLGENWVSDMREYYSLGNAYSGPSVSYRPRIKLPEFQFLSMCEATDLTNDTPKVFISVNGDRDEKREKAFEAAWKLGSFGNRIFDAVFWSQYVNPSWLQVGFDPNARAGKGMVWMRSRDPESVFPDPHGKNDKDWSYVGWEDWYYLDEIRRMWPEKGYDVKGGEGYDDENEAVGLEGSRSGLNLDLPPGSLRFDPPEGFENARRGPRCRVRFLMVRDYAREVIEQIAGHQEGEAMKLVVEPIMKWKFPNGRFLVECNSVILSDGPNFWPRLPEDEFGTFPMCGVWSMPHLESIWGPSPVRYSRGAQDTAERAWTQLLENMIRVNNAQTFIPKDANIDIDAYGGLPAEVQVYDGDKPPTLVWPSPIPQHMTQIPELLLQKVQRYQGFSQQRQGNPGAGNVSTDLYDASVFQSEALTRMKARMLSETYQRITRIIFYAMVAFKTTPDQMQPKMSAKTDACIWNPIPTGAECELSVDTTSIQALSKNALKSLVMALSKGGLLPTKFIFETLELPNADQLADDSQKQLELAALAKSGIKSRPR